MLLMFIGQQCSNDYGGCILCSNGRVAIIVIIIVMIIINLLCLVTNYFE